MLKTMSLQELCGVNSVKSLSTLARMQWDGPEAESFVWRLRHMLRHLAVGREVQ